MNFKNSFNELFRKFQKRTIKKSLIFSLMISCFCAFIMGFLFWFFNVKQFWIAIIAFVVIEAVLFYVFYRAFYPNDKKISRELDSYGLEQRIITMHENQENDSLMARIQRENAKEKLNKFDLNLIKLVLPKFVIVLLVISIILGTGLVTTSALAAKGKIKNGKEVIGEIIPVVINQYEITYEVEGEGEIIGEFFQIVNEGEDGTEVEAVAMDGWVFAGWSDGVEEILRYEADVHENIELVAIFQELGDEDQGEGQSGEGEPGEPSDDERDGEPDESSQSEEGGETDKEPNEDAEGGGEGGKYQPNNQVIDGNTYYGDSTFDAAYESAMESIQQDSNMSDGEKSLIGDYYSTIEK